MCLAVPAKIVELNGDSALADLHGNRVRISTVLTPGVQTGGWVLVHAGFAIEQLNEQCAAETFAMLADAEAAQRVALSGNKRHSGRASHA